MALGLNIAEAGDGGSTGDIIPIIKYDAKGGDLIAVNRHQADDGQWVKDEVEISLPTNFVMDMENIEVGWLAFIGGRPDFVMAKLGEPMPAKPSKEHKQAFRLRIGSTECGLREFSHSAKTVLRPMNELHDKYVAEKEGHKGLMRVVKWAGVERVKVQGKEGELVFKAPIWEIESWVDRPDFFDAASAPDNTPEPAAAQSSGDETPAPLF